MAEAGEQWVVLELGPKAEGEDPDAVRASIRHSIRDAEVFIPASVIQMGDERVVQYLVEGYAFVKRTHPDQTYLRLENTKYVQCVLRQPSPVGGRNVKELACVSSTEIERLRKQIRIEVDQGISTGDLVMITSGPYRQITACVEAEIPELDEVMVHIKLRSKEAIISLPRACLRLVQKAQKSPMRERAEAVQEWLKAAGALVTWQKDALSPLLLPFEKFLRVGDWWTRGREGVRAITAFDVTFDFEPLLDKLSYFERLSKWHLNESRARAAVFGLSHPLPSLGKFNRSAQTWLHLSKLANRYEAGKKLYGFISSVYNPVPPPTLDAKYLDWVWLEDVLERLDSLRTGIEQIEQSLQSKKTRMPMGNLIVDGTQLAARCATAPGLNELRDSQGRPTGAILGFLQSLGSLKKKHRFADIYVAWDCSSQRRKKMFSGYKASRSGRSPFATFEIQELRKILPWLGVHQAFHLEEEADDVIATLVRGHLRGQLNTILSTDRDLLQLVSVTDEQLVPAVGGGKEKRYSVDAVVDEYGVPPEKLISVRAISGDTSDDIPGADGFGLKTASKLVKLYDTLDRLFASNLAGLTKKQYGNLRTAEQQVKLNVELLKLVDDLDLTFVGPDPNQIAATEHLRSVGIKPDPILGSFFSTTNGAAAHA